MIHACINRKILFYRAVPRPNFGGRCGRQQKLEMKINDVMFFSLHPIISINASNLSKYGQLGTSKQAVLSSVEQCQSAVMIMRLCVFANERMVAESTSVCLY